MKSASIWGIAVSLTVVLVVACELLLESGSSRDCGDGYSDILYLECNPC